MSKICGKCGEEKPLDAFHKDSSKSDGVVSACKVCKTAYAKQYRSENPELVKQTNAKKYAKNKDKYKPKKDAWAAANREKVRGYLRASYRANKEAYVAQAAKRRALEKLAVPTWVETEQIKLLYKKASEFALEVDHVVPLNGKTVCGLHCWENLQLLDASLNRSKSNREWPDMWS